MPDEPQDEVIVREFQAELSEGDGRTIDVRIVPYNTPTRVVDTVENGGNGIPYTETFAPGAFDRQTGAVNRVKVWLNFEHQRGLQGIVGHGAALESRDDALYGTFRVHENADGEKALQLVREGILTGISLEAKPLRTRRVGDVVERVRAHLEKVSLCRIGAYEEAQVLAVREQPAPEDDDEPEPAPEPEQPSEAALALQRIGYEPLAVRSVTKKPWKPEAARFTDEEYEASCLILRDGEAPLKERASLPVLEPDGELNVNALGHAAGALIGSRAGLSGVKAPEKAKAARKLLRMYDQAELTPPQGLRQIAAR